MGDTQMKNTMIALATIAMGLTMSSACMAADAKTLADKHGSMWPNPTGWVKKDTCMGCHGSYKDLAKKTERLVPNPHFSHMGDVNCQECHKGNLSKVDFMCNTCHNFTLREKGAK